MLHKFNYSIFIIIIVSFLLLFLGFNNIKYKNANVSYLVYLDGNIVGSVDSDTSFLSFINEKEKKIKDDFGVSKVYLPQGVILKKSYGYSNSSDNYSSIYDVLVKNNSFTIKCVTVTIEFDDNEKRPIVINVLNKKIFDDALNNLIVAFTGVEEYDSYMNGNVIKDDVGSYIESIGISENITYKYNYVSVNDKIFVGSDELSKYLLYGSLDENSVYVVKAGDTISDVAEQNSLNVTEFLIANPNFSDENTLLYEGEEVNVGLINPLLNIETVVHSVGDEVHPFSTDIQYDPLELTIYEEMVRDGEDGLDRVTKKLQYINGQLVETQNISSSEITPSVSKIIKKGSRVATHIADLSFWAWPTNRPYTITTYFGYRWGSMHNALDIAGTGYNSPIYAANNGVVVDVYTSCKAGNISCNKTYGNYVIINHNVKNYYTLYAHMLNVNVKVGDTVERGTKIGTMGNTGSVVPVPSSRNPYGGTHLHFSTYSGNPVGGGRAFNPLSLYR